MGNSIWIRAWGDENQAATYPNLDAGAGGSAEPVAVGAEAQGVDDVPSVQRVEVFALVQIPQHGLAVLGGAPKAIRANPTTRHPKDLPHRNEKGHPKNPKSRPEREQSSPKTSWGGGKRKKP